MGAATKREGAIRSGLLTERVGITAPVQADAGGGSTTTTWATLATVWARVRAMSGAEYARHGGSAEAVAYEVTLRRPLPEVDGAALVPHHGWRLAVTLHGEARTLQVRAARPTERGDGWVLTATEQRLQTGGV